MKPIAAIMKLRIISLFLTRISLLCLCLPNITGWGIIFPLPEPYDHQRNLWTSEQSIAKGYPEAILLDGGAPRFQGTPIAPQYLVTAGHLRENFSDVSFNGVTYQIEGYIQPAGFIYDDTMLVKIKNGKFSYYAKLARNHPTTNDVIICFGSGWSAGNPIKDAHGNLRGWEVSTENKGYRWGLGKISGAGGVHPYSMFWDWTPYDAIVGNDACIFTVGDSGGGMFNRMTKEFVAVIRTTIPSSQFALEPTTNRASCKQAYLFNTNNLYSCYSSNLLGPVQKMEHGFMTSYERTWILDQISPPIRLNAGGPANSNWVNWNSGNAIVGHPAIDTTGITNPAPSEIYASVNSISEKSAQRSLFYSATNLLRTETYKIRLHFSGWPFTKGFCSQDISVNGSIFQSEFDPAGRGDNKASILEALSVTPDSDDKITVQITPHPGSRGAAMISGLEIILNE
jgi:hypothetical protein